MDVINLEERAIENWEFFTKLFGDIVKINVVGIGDGGCSMVEHMIEKGMNRIQPIALNTHLISLIKSSIPQKIQLGAILTNGLGTAMKPEVGKEAAIENYEEIIEALAGSDVVFIVTGLGGGTGTGASSVVAKAAKEINALTVSIVTKPFEWEGQKRMDIANLGLEELKKYSDSVIVIKNDKIKEIDPTIPIGFTIGRIDSIINKMVNEILELMQKRENNDNSIDFADTKTIMNYRDSGLISIDKWNEKNRVKITNIVTGYESFDD